MVDNKNYESGDILWNYTPSGSLEITVREGVEPIDPFSTGFLGENLSYTITEMDGETTIRIISEEYPTLLNTMRVVLDENHLLLDGNLASDGRSEEHTSELQSRGHLVCRLLLEKKKKHNIQ